MAKHENSFTYMYENENLGDARRTATSNLQLFVPAFPGGFDELESTFARTWLFFWPKDYTRRNFSIVKVILDEEALDYQGWNLTKDEMSLKVQSLFHTESAMEHNISDLVSVSYNPYRPKDWFEARPGWFMQQLIMLWADNFTEAEFIGVCDDDTIFTVVIQQEDLFDDRGRPHVIAKYPTNAVDGKYPWQRDFLRQSHYAFQNNDTKGYINGMAYFPAIFRREHLAPMRDAMLANHPEFSTFDELIRYMANKRAAFSQFALMFQYAWDNHRDKYNWHFEADGYEDASFFPGGYTAEYLAKLGKSGEGLQPGTPEENGVTKEMLQPFPRVAVHASYEGGGLTRTFRNEMVSSYIRRGYCNSQRMKAVTNIEKNTTQLAFRDDKSHAKHILCHRYDVEHTAYIYGQFHFEAAVYGELWPAYDHDGALRAHVARMQRNPPHKWDLAQVEAAFATASIKNCEEQAAKLEKHRFRFYQGC